jgi:hypothetical protein
MFWLDEAGADAVQALHATPGADRRLLTWLGCAVAVACMLLGVFVLVGAAAGIKPGPKSAVLPDTPFSVAGSDGAGRLVLPPIPTDAATPLPRNSNAAGGATAPKPCAEPDQNLHLRIPRLCVDAPIVPTRASGHDIEIPADVHTVGVWDGGAPISRPDGSAGDAGSTVVVGHVDDVDQGNGALHDLYLTKPGEAVYLTDSAGHTIRWRAVALQVVVKAALPHELFVGATGPRRLYLVTCGGKLVHLSNGRGGTFGTYEDNVIVTLVPG